MFKKPPTLKPSTPLRSSSRRAFLAHLQALYPVLASAPVEKILQVVPNGLKQCIAITSAGQKAVIYTDDKGKPLWFELGVNAGAALQQAQKKSSQGSQSKLAEVFPTVYTLWILPNLLPRLPTWPQVMDPTLLSGSALMIPGLIPPPDTYPEAEVKVYPPSNSIISITAYPSPVPLVVARSELDMKELCQKRSLGERGKAATAIHTKGDYLWEMGGKLSPPSQEEVKKIEEELAAAKVTDEPHELEQQVEDLDLEETQGNIASSEVADNGSMPENPAPKADKISGPSFTAAEVDAVMYLALLQSLTSLLKQSDQLPMPISSFYSSLVLSNRPAHWPPRDAKGRRSSRLPAHLVNNQEEDAQKPVDADSVDIRRTTAKKLSKWIKNAEKMELLRSKDIKGKDTVITWINSSHDDIKSLSPYYTIAQAQRDLSSTPATQENGTNSTTSISEKTVVVIERFWKASASSVKLFQEMGASTSDPLPLPVIRGYLHDYITSHALIDSKNQAQIRLEDPILVHAMYPKAKLAEIPASLTRQELVDRLANTSCAEYHRTSRLLSERATQVHLANTKGKAGQVGVNGELEPQSEAEYVGVISPGAAKPVNIEIKSRQGRKAVSLVTGLETYGIDPQALANDLMKRGASASATALPNSTAKNPKYEVFVQGDQRKAIYDYVEQHGLDRKFVHLHDGLKK